MPLTNKHLLQLELLKLEGGKTNKDVAKWFTRLFPAVSYPASRLGGTLSRLLEKMRKLFEEGADYHSFLEIVVDFDVVSSSLTKLGLKRGELLNEQKEVEAASEPITQEVIVDLETFRTKESLKDIFTVRWVKQLTNSQDSDKALNIGIKKIMQAYKTLAKNKAKGGVHNEMLASFLGTPFQLHPPARPQPSPSPLDEANKLQLKKEKEITTLQQLVTAMEEELAILKNCLSDLGTDINTLQAAARKSDKQREKLRYMRQKLNRLRETIRQLQPRNVQRLREKVRVLRIQIRATRKTERDLVETRAALLDQKAQLKLISENALRKSRRQRRKIKLLKEQNEEIASLLVENAAADGGHVIETRVKREGNRFSDNIRQTVLDLKGEAVPASRCSKVIKLVAKGIFNHHFADQDLPTTQTTLNICDEGQVLSTIQVAEKVLESNNATLHTDATSRDHKKFVSQQITLNSGETLSLGFYIVPTEDAATLLDLTVAELGQLSELYSEYRTEDQEDIFRQILQKVTSLMSDRAAVMKKFNADFLSFLRSQIGQDTIVHFLYCNAHFLLGLSRSCEERLRQVERELAQQEQPQKKMGRDQFTKFIMFSKSSEAATSRLIRTASDLVGPRGDEKNGCRQDWLAFCEEEGIKSRMTSYRSNRFNCYFEGAAAIVHHHADLCSFVSSLDHPNLKIESVAADLDDPRLMALICAIALVFVRVTGPYWELLQSNVKYSQLYTYIQLLLERMDTWKDDPTSFLDPDYVGIFHGEFEISGDKAALKESAYNFASQHKEAVQKATTKLMPDMLIVLRRQLGDFLEGGIYGGPPAVVPAELEHCPLTNLLGENIFGDLDYDMSKCRNSSVHQRSSTSMLSHNKTAQWLGNKTDAETENLLAFARKKGKALRKQHREQEKVVMLRLRQKLLENKAKKLAKEAKQAAAKTEIIQKLAAVCGPCVTSEDIDALVFRLRRENETTLKNALKDQVKYQKFVLNQKGHLRLMGSIEELTASLKAHLGGGAGGPDDDREPVEKRPVLMRTNWSRNPSALKGRDSGWLSFMTTLSTLVRSSTS